jgi:predicted MFS family arabinose efflux permease
MLYKISTLFLALFILTLDFAMIIPLSPLIAESTGIPIEQAGLLVAIYPALAVISGLVVAPFSDRFGRKPVLVVLLIGLFTSSVVAGIATTSIEIFCARALAGMFAGIIMPIAIAYAGDATDNPADRSKAVTWTLLGIPLAATFGVPIMGLLADASQWQNAFWMVAGLTFVNLLLALRLPHIPTGIKRLQWGKLYAELFALWTRPATRILLSIEFFLVLAVYGLVPQVGPWFSLNFGMSTSAISIAFLIGGLGGVMGNLVASHFVRRGARVGPIATGSTLLVVSVVFATSQWAPTLLPIATLPVVTLGGILFFTMAGNDSRYPSVQVMLTELVPIDLRGRLLLMNIIVTNMAIAIGGTLGSTMVAKQDDLLIGMDRIAYCVVAITLILFVLLRRMSSQYKQASLPAYA